MSPWSLLFLACADDPSPPEAPKLVLNSDGPQLQLPSGPPQALSAAEDLSGAWAPGLAAEVKALPEGGVCPDVDGDGYVSALACPGRPSAELDCNDGDAGVTPATERWVRPGPFLMGSESTHAGADEKPLHGVVMSGYCLDRTEVSLAAVAAWMQASGRRPTGADVYGLRADASAEPGREQMPAEGLTWQEASDYCAAQGKSLPTEAQWEKAARGGCELGSDPTRCDAEDLRPYPWGTAAPTCALANHQLSTGQRPQLCTSDTLPVDSLPEGAGPYGHLHLSGNVWEFVSDWWTPTTYGGPRQDPSGPRQGSVHVLRGGSWNTFSTNMRAANRFTDLVMGSAAGLRCARSSVKAQPDAVPALQMVDLKGSLRWAGGALVGRALYVTAFDEADVEPTTGMLAPGRSPVAELRLKPGGGESQDYSLAVPRGRRYRVFASLDNGTGADRLAYISASGSGGMGQAEGNPYDATGPIEGLDILILAPPAGGAQTGGGRVPQSGSAGGAPMASGPPAGAPGGGAAPASPQGGGQGPGAGQGPGGGPQGGAPGTGRPPGLPPGTPPPQHGGGR